MARFAEADYGAAIALLDAHADRFEANRANTAYLRACIEARRGDQGTAIATLREALNEGIWYSEPVLRQSPSLQSLQGLPEYETLVASFAARPPAESAAAEPVIVRAKGEARGLLVAFHGNGQTARHAADAWRPMADACWTVAAPVSSQMLHSSGAVWDDAGAARADVRRQAPAIAELVPDDRPTLIAGFSLGGDVGLWAALSGTVPASRLLLIGPPAFLQDDPEWPGLLGRAPGVRLHVLLGSEDAAVSAAAIEAMVDALRGAGASVRLERVDGLAHAYPTIERRRQLVMDLAAES